MKIIFKICLFLAAILAKKITADKNISNLTSEPGLNSFINNYLPLKFDHPAENINNSGLKVFSPSSIASSTDINLSTRSNDDTRISTQLSKIFDSDNFLIYFHLTWGK